jgi:hypothetical protein
VVLETLDRPGDVRDPRVGKVQQRSRRRPDGGRSHVRGASGSVDKHRRAGDLGGPRGRAQVLGIDDAVEDHDDRFVVEAELP